MSAAYIIRKAYLCVVIKNNMTMKSKKNVLPKHRQLMIESLELLISGNKTKSKKVLNRATSETEKFYNQNKKVSE